MKCALCNGDLVHKTDSIELKNRTLGKVLVPGLEFDECSDCGDRLISTEEFDRAIEYISQKEQSAINKLPIGDFITANHAADILGFSKQAFSKHPKVKRGLIYSVQLDNRKYYHKKSVEIFKKTGNGKFPLTDYKTIPSDVEKGVFIATTKRQLSILDTIQPHTHTKSCKSFLVPHLSKKHGGRYFYLSSQKSIQSKEVLTNVR